MLSHEVSVSIGWHPTPLPTLPRRLISEPAFQLQAIYAYIRCTAPFSIERDLEGIDLSLSVRQLLLKRL